MMFLGAILFVLIFVLLTPQSQAFLLGLAGSVGNFLTEWAPLSYLVLLILLAAPCVGMYLVHTWPQKVVEGNPMAKYRKEMPVEDD